MLQVKLWLSMLLVVAVMAVPVMAGTNDSKTTNENSANPPSAEASPAAASPSPSPTPSVSLVTTTSDANVAALLGALVKKGVLAPSEAAAIRNAAPAAEFQLLIDALSRKGILSAADLAVTAQPAAVAVPVAATETLASPEAMASSQASAAAPPVPAPPAVIPAIAPVRVFPVDPPKTGGLSGIKAGPITLAPYGFIKATVVHDSSDPDGDDFPFPGIFLNAANAVNTGPTKDPEFHVKARSTRFGANFEWPDVSKNLTLTGKIEGDFEGNFSEVDNRDVSSIRSNMPQLRLAYVRLDYHASDKTDVFFKGGQDWTLFGSGVLPNILETTGLGIYFGDLYTRSPQLTGGLVYTISQEHKVKLEPQFGIMMPSSGQILKLGSLGLAGQLGQGEREGADSDRPEWEGRVALSFQLDPAKGVAPAQIALSGFHASRTSIVTTSNAPYCNSVGCFEPNAAEAAYLASSSYTGFTTSSKMYGGQITLQLPTRWFTIVAQAYRGADLRFYFAGQINSYFTDMHGLSNPVVFTTQDGGPLAAAGSAVLATNAAGQVVVAPQKPIRSFGGFVQLGLPLSRWFNADPHGHNAGWQLYFDVGKDQVVNRDLNNSGATPIGCILVSGVCSGQLTGANDSSPVPLAMGKMAVASLFYKVNNWAQFGFEQSIYANRMLDGIPVYTIAGKPSNEWQDHRTEFGPIFTF
ncbi:MAG: hypothetical protein WCC78_14730 [Terriglobales bacterium]